MGGFAVQITGLSDVLGKLDKLGDTTNIKQAVLEGALMVESTAKTNIQHSAPTGKTYKHHGITHVASSPGEAPSTDTGQLVSSIQHWVSDDGLSIAVGSTLVYASYLEFGTRHIEPRPFLEPAVDVNKDAIIKNITTAVEGSK